MVTDTLSHARTTHPLPARLAAAALALWLVLLPAFAHAFFGEFTIKDEREMGEKFAAFVNSRLPIIHDPEIRGYAKTLGEKLKRVVPPQPWDIDVEVVRANQLNAFAGPAGHVYVFSGLILDFEHEADLVGVMAHEFAHVTQRHLASRIEKAKLLTPLSMLGFLAGALLGGNNVGPALMVGSQAATQTAMLSYSRQDEREADQVGMNYLLEAGYSPEGMVRGFKTMREKQWLAGGGTLPPYMSTHPGLSERIGYISDRIERMPERYKARPEDDRAFKRVQTLLRARYTDPKVALAHYKDDKAEHGCLDYMGLGIVYSRLSRVADADNAFALALSCNDNDPLILREAGRFHFEYGSFKEAGRLLQKAVLISPNDTLALFYYARLLGENGNLEKAVEYMRRAAGRLPEDADVRYHLGRLLGRSGDGFGGHLQLAYAALYSNERDKTRFQMEKAEKLAATSEQQRQLEEFKSVYQKRSAFW